MVGICGSPDLMKETGFYHVTTIAVGSMMSKIIESRD
jgi:hypothetical protein